MTIKLALLKSGEEVISDIDEMITDKKTVVGYYFTNPCRAILTTPEILLIRILLINNQYQLNYYLGCLLLMKKKIPVVADWVISIVEPQPKLKELYTKACENYEKENLKVLVLVTQEMIVTQVEEVQSELGGPDCKLTEPFVYDQENEVLSPWLLNVTTQNTFMISSDKILTLVNPNSKIVKKYESVIEE